MQTRSKTLQALEVVTFTGENPSSGAVDRQLRKRSHTNRSVDTVSDPSDHGELESGASNKAAESSKHLAQRKINESLPDKQITLIWLGGDREKITVNPQMTIRESIDLFNSNSPYIKKRKLAGERNMKTRFIYPTGKKPPNHHAAIWDDDQRKLLDVIPEDGNLAILRYDEPKSNTNSSS